MANYITYLRVSTQRQGDSGLGIEAQRLAVQQYVERVGGILIRENVEIESGSLKSRPVLVQSIAQCRQSKAILLIAKLDRLARNVAFVSSLMESGVDFVAVDAPYANKLMLHILAAFAEHERELISERTRAALAAAKARGVRLGVNGMRLAKQNQQAAKCAAERLRLPVEEVASEGAQTLRQFADKMNDRGLRTRSGVMWSAATVHRLLQRLEYTTANKVCRNGPSLKVRRGSALRTPSHPKLSIF